LRAAARLYVGVGVVIGQSWSTLLAFLPMVIALPAGAGEDGDTPLAAILGITAPIGMTLIAVGVIARLHSFCEHRVHGTRRSDRHAAPTFSRSRRRSIRC